MAAGNAVIGALRVVLGADTAQFEAGLKAAQARLSGFGASVAKGAAVAGAAFVTASAIIGLAAKGAINQADELGKSAQKIGIPVEELSALKHAADLSGIGMESLQKGVAKLSKTLVEAAAKPTSEAANAFKALGLSATNADGSLKSPSQTITEIAGKFEGLKDGAGKTAVSMALLGRSGADLIPLLNSGKAGLAGMMREAEQLGLTIDTKTAKAAEAFNDNLTRLGGVFRGIITQIAAGVAPELAKLTAQMVALARDADLKSWGRSIGEVMTAVFGHAALLSLMWQRLGVEWQAFKNVFTTIPFTEASRKAWDDFNAAGAETRRQVENLKSTLDTAHLADAFGTTAPAVTSTTTALKEFNYVAMGGKNALDGFLASQEKAQAAQNAELQTIGMAAGAKERLRIIEQAYQIAQQNGILLTEAMRLKISETAFAAEQLALKLQGAQLIQQNLAPGEMFRMEMENNRLALEAFGATAEQVGRVQEATAQKYGATWQQAGSSIAQSFQQIGQAFSKESKAMAIVAKAAGLVHATISMFVGAAKALELPFPANLAAWATVIATGAQAVAGIKGVNAGGFATGGAIRVPGGMGGGDRVRAMVDLEPGEQLDIWRPDQSGPDPRRGGAGEAAFTTIVVQAPDLSREWVGGLIERINGAVNDGYRLQIAAA